MNHSVSPSAPRAASTDFRGHRGLDGFEVRCSCGFVATNTVRSNVEQDGRDHVAWSQRQTRKGGR